MKYLAQALRQAKAVFQLRLACATSANITLYTTYFASQKQLSTTPLIYLTFRQKVDDFHRASPRLRGVEYSKAITFHGPKIRLWTIQNSVYPALVCLSAATPRVCYGSQRPNTEGC